MLKDHLSDKSTEDSAEPYVYDIDSILNWAKIMDNNSSEEALEDLLDSDREEIKDAVRELLRDSVRLSLYGVHLLMSVAKLVEFSGIEEDKFTEEITGPASEALAGEIKFVDDPDPMAQFMAMLGIDPATFQQ